MSLVYFSYFEGINQLIWQRCACSAHRAYLRDLTRQSGWSINFHFSEVKRFYNNWDLNHLNHERLLFTHNHWATWCDNLIQGFGQVENSAGVHGNGYFYQKYRYYLFPIFFQSLKRINLICKKRALLNRISSF